MTGLDLLFLLIALVLAYHLLSRPQENEEEDYDNRYLWS